MEKRKLPRCEDANAPQRDQETLWEDQGRWASRVAGDLGPEAQEATRHLGWYLVRGCRRRGRRGGGQEPEGQASIVGDQEGEALPLQRERH